MLPVLIVDDCREDALLAERVLSQCKVLNPVHVLNGGDDCLDYFDAIGQFADRTLPCLVLLDMIMAPMSGLDVLRSVRKRSDGGAGSTFVMLSGLTDLNTIHNGYQLGAKTFLVKPLHPEDVMQMLNSIQSIVVQDRAEGYELSFRDSAVPARNEFSGEKNRLTQSFSN